MHSQIFTELSLVVAIGALVALVMRLLRQPLIIGHIITGLLAGPLLFDLTGQEAAFAGFSSLGVALLLFSVGLELSTKVFARLGKAVFVTAGTQVTITGVVGVMTARLLGFEGLEALIIGIGLALSSTIIIVKLLGDKKETTRLYAQIAIGVLILQDIIATGVKIGLAPQAHSGGDQAGILGLFAKVAGVVLLLALASRFVIPRLTRLIESSRELLLLFSLGWGLGFASLFEQVGFSIEIGALFAGISLAGMPYGHEMVSRLKPLRDFFLVIFFITLGQSLTADLLGRAIGPALVLSAVVLLLKPLTVMLPLGLLGYTRRTSFKTAIANTQISEFSLVLMASAFGSGLVGRLPVTVLTLTALITFAVSAYLIKYDDKLYTQLERHLRLFERKVTIYGQRDARHSYPIVLFGYHKGGPEFMKTFKRMDKRFVVVDYDPEVMDLLERQHMHSIYGDATDPELLEEISLDKAKLVVSTISDFKANTFLAHWLNVHNAGAVFICPADNFEQAAELYGLGVSYVMMPHFIGSEKISAFIRRNGFNKTEFKRYRQKHLDYVRTHFELAEGA